VNLGKGIQLKKMRPDWWKPGRRGKSLVG